MSKIIICGSVKSSMEDIQKVAAYQMRKGNYVMFPQDCNGNPSDEYLSNWIRSMYNADKVIFVKKRDGSLGESCRMELAIARKFFETKGSSVTIIKQLSGEDVDRLSMNDSQENSPL